MQVLSVERVIRPRRGLVPVDMPELWRYRELFVFLAWRNILVRYKQTALGITWAVVQPLVMMLVMTLVFGRMARLPSHGIPYPVLALAALVPWQLFAGALSQSSLSTVADAQIISKIYFPRLVIPCSAVLASFVDFLISSFLLMALMAYYGLVPTWNLVFLPGFVLLALMLSLGAGLWFAALNVAYRDVKYVVPFALQAGLFISPVGFSSSVVPEQYRTLFSMNPMVGVIDGFRWCLLGEQFTMDPTALWVSSAVVLLMFVSGVYYFRAMERTFADLI